MRKELLFWSNRKKATLKQLQVLTGHLVHCASVIRGGNAYINHVLTALRWSKERRRIKLTKEFHSDLNWWFELADNFNYRPMDNRLMKSHKISMFSGFQTITTESPTLSEIEWPCVYVSCDAKEYCIPMFRADDRVICYDTNDCGLGMYLPDDLLFDDAGMEICATWLALQLNDTWCDCVINIICPRKLTWWQLSKFRSKNILLSCVFKQMFLWSINRNIWFEFVYMPIV